MAIPADLAPAEEYRARWTELTRQWAERPGCSLGTLGPAGTSSHLTAVSLAERYGLRIALLPSFDAVLDELVTGDVEFALVPSAYQGLTRFHWHGGLRLRAFFAQATPEYGIAARADAEPGPPPGTAPVSVAAMWEVRRIYAEVAPAALGGRPVRWVDAGSTQDAAAILARGGADLAVTNAPGVRAHGLRWVATRPGAEVVWTLFGHAEA